MTALTTNLEKTKGKFGDKIKATQADYSSITSLALSLKGFDALVCLISRVEPEAQNLVLDAAIKAGVPHIIPSCFAVDMSISEIENNPGLREKKVVVDYLIKRSQESNITFTGIQTGIFLDWALTIGLPLNCKGDRPTIIYDSGDVMFSATVTDDIGKAIASALSKPLEFKNRFLLMHSVATTQNQLLEYAKEARPDLPWPTTRLDTEELYENSLAALARGDHSLNSLMGFMPRSTFGLGHGYFNENDNDSLGVKVWTTEQLKSFLVAEIAKFQQQLGT